jgi:4-hydroxybenzoate polyprenyltransferase
MSIAAARRDDIEDARPAPRRVASLIRAVRPHQWTKNLLLFAGIVFAAEFTSVESWLRALAIFAAYCAASSAAYLVNDVRDAEADRLHPVKKHRPIAAGDLSKRAALATAAVLILAAFGLAAFTGLESVGVLAGFVGLQAAYTGLLKHVVLLDLIIIALLFVIRAAAGAVAVDVELSPWLVVCTGLLALFLALVKRRAELVLVNAKRTPGRIALQGYTIEFVDQLVSIVAAAAIGAYSIYTFTATESTTMMITLPYVVFGMFRYLFLIHHSDRLEEPERILVSDRPILLTVVLWVATAAVILAVG